MGIAIALVYMSMSQYLINHSSVTKILILSQFIKRMLPGNVKYFVGIQFDSHNGFHNKLVSIKMFYFAKQTHY